MVCMYVYLWNANISYDREGRMDLKKTLFAKKMPKISERSNLYLRPTSKTKTPSRIKIVVIIVLSLILLFTFRSLAKTHKLEGESPNFAEKRGREMPMKSLEATLLTFDGVFERFTAESANNKANFILFLADIDPSTNLSWCPDCVRAEPVIYKKLEAASGNVSLLKVYVGDRPTWRNPQHPWRVDSRFKLTGVPTLIRWENGSVKARLEDHEAHLERKIDTLLSD